MRREREIIQLYSDNGDKQKKNVFFQPKLTINQPNDVYEQEADAMADRVLKKSIQNESRPFFSPKSDSIQRKCSACEKDEEVQLKPISKISGQQSSSHSISEPLSQKINSTRGSGHKMDSNTLQAMNNSFGMNFDEVNIHTGNDASQMNAGINARAFTIGRDIYFNQGEYNPNTQFGQWLLAHELTHVVQQNFGANPSRIQRYVSSVEINCDGQFIDFKRAGKSTMYSLEVCDVTAGEYNADVMINDQGVDFTLDNASPDTKFEFRYAVKKGQPNPTEFFKGQSSVKIYCTTVKVPKFFDDNKLDTEYNTLKDWIKNHSDDQPLSEDEKKYYADIIKVIQARCLKPGPSFPEHVSQVLVDRIMGKYENKDGDHGEGLEKTPYMAAEGQCTIGYGHVIFPKNLCQVNPDNRQKCICQEPWNGITAGGAESLLKTDLIKFEKHVKETIKVDLTQGEFDAIVDLAAHVGSVPKSFVQFLHDNWCIDRPKVREQYLKTAITMKDPKTKEFKEMQNFIDRRRLRAW